MSFQLNSIAGSASAATLAQQVNTANEQEQGRVYRQELAKELARHAQQTEEEVAAANQDGHRRIGDRSPEQRKRQARPHHQPEPETAESDEDFAPAEPHLLDVKDNDTAPRPTKPAGNIDMTA